MRELGFPVVFDATHAVQLPGGAGPTVRAGSGATSRARAAVVAFGVDALFLEMHEDPTERCPTAPALRRRTMLRIDDLPRLLRSLRIDGASGVSQRRPPPGSRTRVRLEAEAILGLIPKLTSGLTSGRPAHRCAGRVIVTGMGKSGLIGARSPRRWRRTARPRTSCIPRGRSHGDLGVVARGDVGCWSSRTRGDRRGPRDPAAPEAGSVSARPPDRKPALTLARQWRGRARHTVPEEAVPDEPRADLEHDRGARRGDALAMVLLELPAAPARDTFLRDHLARIRRPHERQDAVPVDREDGARSERRHGAESARQARFGPSPPQLEQDHCEGVAGGERRVVPSRSARGHRAASSGTLTVEHDLATGARAWRRGFRSGGRAGHRPLQGGRIARTSSVSPEFERPAPRRREPPRRGRRGRPRGMQEGTRACPSTPASRRSCGR